MATTSHPSGHPTTPEARVDAVVAQVRPFDEANLRVNLEQVFEASTGNITLNGGLLQEALRAYIGAVAVANALGELPPDRKPLELAVRELNNSLSAFLARLRVQFSRVQQEPISQVLEVSEELGAGHLPAAILQSLSRKRPDELIEEYIAALRTPHLQLMGKAEIPDLPAAAGREPIVVKTELMNHFVAAAKEAHEVSVQQLRASLLAKEQEAERTERAANALKRVPKKANEAAASFLVNPLDRQTYINEERALFVMCGGVIRDLTGKRFGAQNTGEVEALLAEGFPISATLRTRIQEADDLMDVYSEQGASAFVEGKIAEIRMTREEAVALCAKEYVQWFGGKLSQVFAAPAGTNPEEVAIYEDAVEKVVQKVSETMSGHAADHYAEILGRLVPLLPSAALPLLAGRVQQTATSLGATAGALQSSASVLSTAIEGLSSDAFFTRLASEVARAVAARPAPLATPISHWIPAPAQPAPVNVDIDANEVVVGLLKHLPRVLAAMQNPREAGNTLTRALVAAGMEHMDAEQLSQNLLSYPLRGISATPLREVIVKFGQYELTRGPRSEKVIPAPSSRRPRAPTSRRTWVVGGLAVGLGVVALGTAGVRYGLMEAKVSEDIGTIRDWIEENRPKQISFSQTQPAPVEAPVAPFTPTEWRGIAAASYPTSENPSNTQWITDLSANMGADVSQGAIAVQCIGGQKMASATQPAEAHSFPIVSEALTPEGGINWLVDGCQVKGYEAFTVGSCVPEICARQNGFFAVALTPKQN